MFSRVYSQLTKLSGITENKNSQTIYRLATVFHMFLNDKTYRKLEKIGQCKEAEYLLKQVVIFIYNVVLCSENEFFDLWGEDDIMFDIYDIIEDCIINDEEIYDVIIKIQKCISRLDNQPNQNY